MTRTTLAIEEGLLRRLEQRAADEGRSLQAVANDLLRQALARAARRSPFKLELHGWSGSFQVSTSVTATRCTTS